MTELEQLLSDMMHDHAPHPGPGHWDFRCMVCDEPVRNHANALQRWLWRRRKRRNKNLELPRVKVTTTTGTVYLRESMDELRKVLEGPSVRWVQATLHYDATSVVLNADQIVNYRETEPARVKDGTTPE